MLTVAAPPLACDLEAVGRLDEAAHVTVLVVAELTVIALVAAPAPVTLTLLTSTVTKPATADRR